MLDGRDLKSGVATFSQKPKARILLPLPLVMAPSVLGRWLQHHTSGDPLSMCLKSLSLLIRTLVIGFRDPIDQDDRKILN